MKNSIYILVDDDCLSRAYAEQTDSMNRMRGMLEDEMTMKRNNMMKQMQEENKRLAQEKKDRERNWRDNQERQNQQEIVTTNSSNIMTENPNTTMSKLADHRYVPYHFKGLRPDQVEEIKETHTNQLREHKTEKQRQQEED
jgi:hypothetical protein